jgi:hypothetical protein
VCDETRLGGDQCLIVSAAPRRALVKGVAMVIGNIMLILLGLVILAFVLGAVWMVIKSAGR